MSVTHTKKTTWVGVGDSLTATDAVTADAEQNPDIVINPSTTNQLVAFAVLHAKIQLVYLVSDAPVTIKTNSSGSPTDTITLVAGIPVAWTINEGLSHCPFSADVTSLYLTNSGTKQANVTLRCLYNL